MKLTGQKRFFVVFAVETSDVSGPELVIRFVQEKASRNVEMPRHTLVVIEQASVRVFEISNEGAAVHKILEAFLPCGEPDFGSFRMGESLLEFAPLDAQLETSVHLARENAECIALLEAEGAGNKVHYAKGPHSKAVRVRERNPGVKAPAIFAFDHGIVREAGIECGVLDEKQV